MMERDLKKETQCIDWVLLPDGQSSIEFSRFHSTKESRVGGVSGYPAMDPEL